MDWIEQLFGIDPDMGSGSLELLIAGAVVIVAVGLAVRIRSRRDERAVLREERAAPREEQVR